MYTFEEHGVAAAKWLDEVYPKWYMDIDIERLNMLNPQNCILGQLFGDKVSVDNSHLYGTGYGWARRNLPGFTDEYDVVLATWTDKWRDYIISSIAKEIPV